MTSACAAWAAVAGTAGVEGSLAHDEQQDRGQGSVEEKNFHESKTSKRTLLREWEDILDHRSLDPSAPGFWPCRILGSRSQKIRQMHLCYQVENTSLQPSHDLKSYTIK